MTNRISQLTSTNRNMNEAIPYFSNFSILLNSVSDMDLHESDVINNLSVISSWNLKSNENADVPWVIVSCWLSLVGCIRVWTHAIWMHAGAMIM